jgi:hypothetical protein
MLMARVDRKQEAYLSQQRTQTVGMIVGMIVLSLHFLFVDETHGAGAGSSAFAGYSNTDLRYLLASGGCLSILFHDQSAYSSCCIWTLMIGAPLLFLRSCWRTKGEAVCLCRYCWTNFIHYTRQAMSSFLKGCGLVCRLIRSTSVFVGLDRARRTLFRLIHVGGGVVYQHIKSYVLSSIWAMRSTSVFVGLDRARRTLFRLIHVGGGVVYQHIKSYVLSSIWVMRLGTILFKVAMVVLFDVVSSVFYCHILTLRPLF